MRFLFLAIGLMMFSGFPQHSVGQNGDDKQRLIFLGDSITQAGARPNGYVSLFRDMVQSDMKGFDVEVIGAGISGNRVPDLQKRLKRDVLEKKPSIVVIYIGINDVWHSQNGRGTSEKDFEAGLQDVIRQIKGVGAKVVLCTPSVIGEKTDGSNPLDGMLEDYSQISRSVAKQTGADLIDLRVAFIDHLKKAQNGNSEKKILTTDGVHLNQAGNEFVAQQMLKGVKKSVLRSVSDAQEAPKKASVGSAGKKLRHVVMFQFAEGVTPAEIDQVVKAFGELENQIDTIKGYEFGTNISEENLSQGFTHCFFVTFDDEAGLKTYLPHPAHQDFVAMLDGKIGKVLVFDYWTE